MEPSVRNISNGEEMQILGDKNAVVESEISKINK